MADQQADQSQLRLGGAQLSLLASVEPAARRLAPAAPSAPAPVAESQWRQLKLVQGANFHPVRTMIGQHAAELLLISVIVTYLIYYFAHISSRPKLIGMETSQFVEFVRRHLKQTLAARFNPLLYFWGTNPQTALFGYLQGRSSEMARSEFRRQYLYVSDAQYLASNVDLSRHYGRLAADAGKASGHFQLEPASLEQRTSRLDSNIRLALSELLARTPDGGLMFAGQSCGAEPAKGRTELSSAGSSSSSDSGVFAGCPVARAGSSACSSSSSLLSELSADEPASSARAQCRCKAPGADLLGAWAGRLQPDGRPQQSAAARRHLEATGEFGQCALDWHLASHANYHKRRLVALISAGMTTGSDKKYVTDTVRTLQALGFEVCVFIRRGVGGLALSSARFFSPSKWRDFEAAVGSVRQQRPGAHLVAVGFSFGSIELCRYLSMSGGQSQVAAALLVSCPFDPEAGGRNMRRRALNRRIDAYLARSLARQLHSALVAGAGAGQPDEGEPARPLDQVRTISGSTVDLSRLAKIKSLVDFEDNYNRRLQNYPSSEAYADDSRLSDYLGAIQTPTLCLSSEDDFMAPLRLLPVDQIRANPNLCMILTKRGGHMAFIDGLLWPKRPYFAQRVIGAYLGAMRDSLLSRSLGLSMAAAPAGPEPLATGTI